MYLNELQNKLLVKPLSEIPDKKILISTMNAYSFWVLQKDEIFQKAITNSHLILSDGISIVWAIRMLNGTRLKKIAGTDLLEWELKRLQKNNGKCFFLGSCTGTLKRIYARVKQEYPNVSVQYYEPPFKPAFSDEDDETMIRAVNSFAPDVLFIGLTAPKQEKWGASNFDRLNVNHICCIGAAFDFYALTIQRAPVWMINAGLEWFYRLLREPKRTWKRYLIGNSAFVALILKEKLNMMRARVPGETGRPISKE
jgi:N-acetylglucosaminyldiphosphoundecaprenol N-acetyl-beta-D-mannosaminyltransferase